MANNDLTGNNLTGNDLTEEICAQVSLAFDSKQPLRITAGSSKSFYGRTVEGKEISVAAHSGIIDYRASELVLTARSGTRLIEIEGILADNQQMLAFEPPVHSPNSTLGGSIACGLSGPRRPYAGAARDFVLGTTIINGKGERLKFGGQVMKNVAGYDASRLMTGAQGTLGVLLDISIKVLPVPDSEMTLCFEQDFETAHNNLRQWILQGHPITASCYFNDQLFLRLSSTVNSTKSAHASIGGDLPGDDVPRDDSGGNELWTALRHQTHEFFQQHNNLWRVSVPPSAKTIASGQPQLTEWNGALRWIASDEDLFSAARETGGHATRYRLPQYLPNEETVENIFQPLPAGMLALHRRLKESFDPENILNPGRLYPGL